MKFIWIVLQVEELRDDPDEFHDLGTSSEHDDVRSEMEARLLDRLTSRKNRITTTDEEVFGIRQKEDEHGIIIGKW